MIPQTGSKSLRMCRGTLALARSSRTVIRTAPIRHLSSETTPPSQSSRAPLLLAAALGSGALGYAIAQTVSADEQQPIVNLNAKPVYGSPQDFQKAIKELQAAFPDADAVSTDLDDLQTHGFSANDWHPGMSLASTNGTFIF